MQTERVDLNWDCDALRWYLFHNNSLPTPTDDCETPITVYQVGQAVRTAASHLEFHLYEKIMIMISVPFVAARSGAVVARTVFTDFYFSSHQVMTSNIL